MKRVGLAGVALAMMFLTMPAGAWASASVYLCVPTARGAPVTSGGAGGSCGEKNTKVALPAESAEQKKLLAILPYLKYVGSAVGGKPTIEVTGANLQILSGSGKTNGAVNGAGNLVIGYDENKLKRAQTGSHNLILGNEQSFTSFAGILGGHTSTITAPYASVTGGIGNAASGEGATVSGGEGDEASGRYASVSGGFGNGASAEWAGSAGALETSPTSKLAR